MLSTKWQLLAIQRERGERRYFICVIGAVVLGRTDDAALCVDAETICELAHFLRRTRQEVEDALKDLVAAGWLAPISSMGDGSIRTALTVPEGGVDAEG